MGRRRSVLLAVLVLASPACSRGGNPTPNVITQHQIMLVNDEPTGICLALPATIGDRYTGLGNRPSIPPKEGMAFTFPRPSEPAFTMKDTSFPLAIVWVGPDSAVLGSTTMTPLSVSDYLPPGPVRLAIELSPQDWGPLAGTARTAALGGPCDGTIVAGRPGQPRRQF